jgi:hypothetical protein
MANRTRPAAAKFSGNTEITVDMAPRTEETTMVKEFMNRAVPGLLVTARLGTDTLPLFGQVISVTTLRGVTGSTSMVVRDRAKGLWLLNWRLGASRIKEALREEPKPEDKALYLGQNQGGAKVWVTGPFEWVQIHGIKIPALEGLNQLLDRLENV